jgi:hypothetical protein
VEGKREWLADAVLLALQEERGMRRREHQGSRSRAAAKAWWKIKSSAQDSKQRRPRKRQQSQEGMEECKKSRNITREEEKSQA